MLSYIKSHLKVQNKYQKEETADNRRQLIHYIMSSKLIFCFFFVLISIMREGIFYIMIVLKVTNLLPNAQKQLLSIFCFPCLRAITSGRDLKPIMLSIIHIFVVLSPPKYANQQQGGKIMNNHTKKSLNTIILLFVFIYYNSTHLFLIIL